MGTKQAAVHLKSVTREKRSGYACPFMSFMKLLNRCILVVVFTLICASVAHTATVGVAIGNNFFNPVNVAIRPGDRIMWTNFGSAVHDTTHNATPRLWASPNLSPGGTFGFTFTNVGYYPYYCEPHRLQLQTGSVSVVNISLANVVRTPTTTQFQIRGGRSGLKAVVEAGENLGSATPIQTNTFPSTGLINFTDTNPPPTRRFYRSRVIP
jgi:plastocyanin